MTLKEVVQATLRCSLFAVSTVAFALFDIILLLALAASSLVCADEFADRWKTEFVERDSVGSFCLFLKSFLDSLISASGLQEQFLHVSVFDRAFMLLVLAGMLLCISAALRYLSKIILMESSVIETVFEAVASVCRVVLDGLLNVLIVLVGSPILLLKLLREKLTDLKEKTTRTNSFHIIKEAPGQRWLKFAEFFFSPETVKMKVVPTLADWQEEYFEALQKQNLAKARWISVRYNWAMIKVLWLSDVLELIEALRKIAKK